MYERTQGTPYLRTLVPLYVFGLHYSAFAMPHSALE
jgi:hypothetical protein